MRIVFDIDGVITDIWTPLEWKLRSYSQENALPAGITREFCDSFLFSRDVTDFNMTSLTDSQRKLILDYFKHDSSLFRNPLPMYDLQSVGSQKCLDIFTETGDRPRPSFEEWGTFLNSLCRHGADVVLHTHVHPDVAGGRLDWFNREIKPIAPDVELKLDCGASKSILRGDIVIEDNLNNLASAEAKVKVLRCCFHNVNHVESVKDWEIAPHCVYSFGDIEKFFKEVVAI